MITIYPHCLVTTFLTCISSRKEGAGLFCVKQFIGPALWDVALKGEVRDGSSCDERPGARLEVLMNVLAQGK
jgi:hypothetical protein